MSYQIRYYPCPRCGRHPHIRYTDKMKDKVLKIECEFCLHTFEIDERTTPPVKPDTHPIQRQ